jgi:hypothetical protein
MDMFKQQRQQQVVCRGLSSGIGGWAMWVSALWLIWPVLDSFRDAL